MIKERYKCTCCGNEKPDTDYYASQSYIYKNTGKLSICKDCVWNYVILSNNENGYSIEKMKDLLQMIDKPFVQFLLDSSIEEANRDNKNTFKVYMKNLGLKQNRELRWSNSQFENFRIPTSNDNSDINGSSTDDVFKYWGKGYSKWEIDFLEDEMMKLTSSFECPDYGMEMIMRDICFINLDIEKVRQERKANSGTEITKLIKTRSDLMNDANMKPIQSTGAEGNDQITFGTLIKKWENEKPVPRPLEDEMKEYIDTFMVGHLAKMEGLNNELTAKYDKALSEYTINFSDINRDEEEYDD